MSLAALGLPLPDRSGEPQDAFPSAFAAAMRALHGEAGGAETAGAAVAQAAHDVAAAILAGHAFIEPDRLLLQPLAASPVVAQAPDASPPRAPLVLEGGRLYLARYWQYERTFRQRLRALNRPTGPVDPVRLAALLKRHFAAPPPGPDWQKVAAATAVLRHLCVISGGPGTGKTTTVVKILAILLELQPELRIAIAAPTGKAAARVQESIRSQLESLQLPPALIERLPREPHTLHRLLRWQPGQVTFRHHAGNPLPCDVVVVDEASMLDLALAAKLVEALPQGARLILLGDKDQLASVEAGAVFAGISSARSVSADWGATLSAATGEALPALPAAPGPLPDAVVWLSRSHRFGPDSPLARLAAAINAGDGAAVAGVLGSGAQDVQWVRALPPPRALAGQLAAGYTPFVEAVQGFVARASPRLDDARAVFSAFDAFRVLCSTRAGSYGSVQLGDHLLQSLRRSLGVPAAETWFAGRPVLVTRNDYALRLFNGDVGIALPGADGRLQVAFPAADGGVRTISPAQLGDVEQALAITVHRAQGSEFQRVGVVLEPELPRGLSRALLYTAVTRAQRAVVLHATAAAVAQAVDAGSATPTPPPGGQMSLGF